MTQLSNVEYLNLGRQIARLLGGSLEGASADALRELAKAYAHEVNDSRVSAEVFLLHKFLIIQACVGVFPESQVEHVVGGFLAALNEQVRGLDLSSERQQAMEEMWRLRAAQFDGSFGHDRIRLLEEGPNSVQWKETIERFCQNVQEMADPPNLWAGTDGPSQLASCSVTLALDQMVTALSEMNRLHFSNAM